MLVVDWIDSRDLGVGINGGILDYFEDNFLSFFSLSSSVTIVALIWLIFILNWLNGFLIFMLMSKKLNRSTKSWIPLCYSKMESLWLVLVMRSYCFIIFGVKYGRLSFLVIVWKEPSTTNEKHIEFLTSFTEGARRYILIFFKWFQDLFPLLCIH